MQWSVCSEDNYPIIISYYWSLRARENGSVVLFCCCFVLFFQGDEAADSSANNMVIASLVFFPPLLKAGSSWEEDQLGHRHINLTSYPFISVKLILSDTDYSTSIPAPGQT